MSDTPRTDAATFTVMLAPSTLDNAMMLPRKVVPVALAHKLERELSAVTRERDEARETVDYRNALVRSLANSLKKITFMARTSGGWKPDANLIAACEQAEQVLSLSGMSKVIDERDALRAEVERLRGLFLPLSLAPDLYESVHGPRYRCRQCGYAWMQDGKPQKHSADCAYVAAHAALQEPTP